MLLKMHTAPSYSSGKNVFWNVSGLLFIGSFWRSPGFLVQISLQGNSLSVHIGCLLVLLQDRRQIFRAREQNKENTAHSFAWFSVPLCSPGSMSHWRMAWDGIFLWPLGGILIPR